jgi:cytochrome d ubiquinol oxidase subunit I
MIFEPVTSALFWHRLQFAFTVTYHYLFPQLTMGLAFLIVVLKWLGLRSGDPRYDETARFWGRILGINFAVGVVTGIPLEFQFGTNWAQFSDFAGGVIGQTLALEGLFAFFLESSFLGLFLFGEKKLGRRGHYWAAFAVFLGAWISGYFIIVTNAFMQHPVGHVAGPDGRLQIESFWTFVLNRWAIWEYLHNMCASVVTASFVVAAIGANWMLMRNHERHAALNVRLGVISGLAFSLLLLFPTGDQNGKMVAKHQPNALAAMEGVFESGPHKEIAIIGQPDVEKRILENPVVVPGVLSFLAYGTFASRVGGLNDVPREEWPDNVELLYYAYHIMAGLGSIFMLIMTLSAFLLWRGRLYRSRAMLWVLMLAWPCPYIATTAGWLTAELGRQPWLVYGLLRTAQGGSPTVSAGNVAFTTIGFMGLYLAVGIVFLYLVGREIAHGPVDTAAGGVEGRG